MNFTADIRKSNHEQYYILYFENLKKVWIFLGDRYGQGTGLQMI